VSRVALSWSSGKDSAWSLHTLRRQAEHEVAVLVTTINMEYERVAMHAVRRQLVNAQAEVAGLPLIEVPIPNPCSNADYDAAMTTLIEELKRHDIDHMAFGDLYLPDIRAYREDRLTGTGITPLFPLWQQPTSELAQQMIDGGLKAVLTCVDPKQLAPEFSGRPFDQQLLHDLPDSVDPCGENGEFHSFVFDGPMFRQPVAITVGETIEREGFYFTDVRPVA
jgi:uncharacterized protein (TIGR00290 family)